MVIKVNAAEQPHDMNQLHDELMAAGVRPRWVMKVESGTEIKVAEGEAEAAHKTIALHKPKPRSTPLSRKGWAQLFRQAKTAPELAALLADFVES